ncbi:MAG: BMP family ABC transporter substrate-binding protein [Oscillospiraceae bacterium]|nr:BMP family ABC transporter substrate-binding protein [Oscillospiraceae bacterium]
MKRNLLALFLTLALALSLAACNGGTAATPTPTGGTPENSTAPSAAPSQEPSGGIAKEDLKIGFVHIGDESDKGYTYNMVQGTKEMLSNLGIDESQLVVKYNTAENDACADAINACLDAGCQLIFTTSYGFQSYAEEAAKAEPDVQFVQLTGDTANAAGLSNYHNAFADIYEGRYLAGVVAGMKAKEIGNPKLGYVGAFPFAEVISGYTAFYLGAKSVYPEVTMEVNYTNTWNDADLESRAAQSLIDRGAGVISQHSDSTGPATTAEKNGKFQVGYNADMTTAAPGASLISPRINWGPYFTKCVQSMIDGTAIPTDFTAGYKDGSVVLTDLNEAIAAPGTKEALETAEAAIVDGSLEVFQGPMKGSAYDSNGNVSDTLELSETEAFQESDVAGGKNSAPSFCYVIEGITIIQ